MLARASDAGCRGREGERMMLSRVFGLTCALIAACSTTDAPSHDEPDAGRSQQRADAAPSADASADAGARVFDAGRDPKRNRAEPGHLCARVAAIECAGEAACCEQPGRERDACLSEREAACNEALPLDVLSEAPEVGFDVDRASDALAELERRASTCDPQIASWFASSEGLSPALAGTLGKNDSCAPAGGGRDARAIVVALYACQLAAGLSCVHGTGGSTCAPRSRPGDFCEVDRSCADGLYCDAPEAAAAACRERRPAGEACTRAAECASLVCHAGACGADGDVQAAYCP
jgi:hypothetical protein